MGFTRFEDIKIRDIKEEELNERSCLTVDNAMGRYFKILFRMAGIP